MIQIFKPAQPIALLSIKPSAAFPPGPGQTVVIPFVLPTPDSRLTLSFALVITQVVPTTMPFDVTTGSFVHSLWLAESNYDTGGSGLLVPTGNLVGTRSVPQGIPTDVNICGYADDFQGGQDAITGEYTLLSSAGNSPANGLRVAIYVSYEATETEICDAEWSEIVSLLGNLRAPQQQVFS